MGRNAKKFLRNFLEANAQKCKYKYTMNSVSKPVGIK